VTSSEIRDDRVALRPTSSNDLATARRLFQDPGVYAHWGGVPLDDSEIAEKYLGARSPDVECFFVVENGEVVGFTQCYRGAEGGPGGGGMDLVLLPAARGRGIGQAVVDAVVAHVRALGWRRFVVDPDVSNEAGVAFWRAVGFRPVRVVADDGDREPYWLLEWPLPPSGDDGSSRGTMG
jgi:aminoglycoside 6'-N-acetyltransferase